MALTVERKPIKIRDLVDGYSDDLQTGHVVGFGGKLDIRPIYQREFVYNEKEQKEVINTIVNGFPLNVMYWVERDDGTFEVLDGQQRTLSICKYVCDKSFSISIPSLSSMPLSYGTLERNAPDIANSILDYELDVYICSGDTSEKLAWFKIINTYGEKVNEQEIRNATYAGSWCSSAKAYFSKANGLGVDCAVNNGAKTEPLLLGSYNRQDFLKTALDWIADRDGLKSDDATNKIEKYMDLHMNDADASQLWQYFNSVICWTRSTFTNYRSKMNGLPFGLWYNAIQRGEVSDTIITKSASEIETKILELIADEEIESKDIKALYWYIFDGKLSHLQFRQFDEKTKRAKYEEQDHKCPYCLKEGNNKDYEYEEMEGDHIKPWSIGGKTEIDNCQMLCKHHNSSKGANY